VKELFLQRLLSPPWLYLIFLTFIYLLKGIIYFMNLIESFLENDYLSRMLPVTRQDKWLSYYGFSSYDEGGKYIVILICTSDKVAGMIRIIKT